VLLYSLTGSDQLIFIPERIKDTVSEGFDQRIDYRYKSLKRRLENGGKRHRRKKASLVVNRFNGLRVNLTMRVTMFRIMGATCSN
jgi:hypothetical protein